MKKLTWRTSGKQTSLKPSRLESASLLEFDSKANKVIFYLPELDIVNGIKEELFDGDISENKQSYEKPPIKYLILSRRSMELVKLLVNGKITGLCEGNVSQALTQTVTLDHGYCMYV